MSKSVINNPNMFNTPFNFLIFIGSTKRVVKLVFGFGIEKKRATMSSIFDFDFV